MFMAILDEETKVWWPCMLLSCKLITSNIGPQHRRDGTQDNTAKQGCPMLHNRDIVVDGLGGS
jgi:hypothetical protein